jgi:hypothetical protein
MLGLGALVALMFMIPFIQVALSQPVDLFAETNGSTAPS